MQGHILHSVWMLPKFVFYLPGAIVAFFGKPSSSLRLATGVDWALDPKALRAKDPGLRSIFHVKNSPCCFFWINKNMFFFANYQGFIHRLFGGVKPVVSSILIQII